MNLISLIKDQLSGDVIAKLASLLGVEEEKALKAITAAVPALLSAVSGLASSSGGADKLISTLRTADPGVLGNLGDIFAKGDSGAILQKGGGILGSLLGDGALSKIISVLTKFAAMSPETTKKLLSFIAPLVISAILSQFKGKAPTPDGLRHLFSEQKANIANALPAGLSLADLPDLSKTGAAVAQEAGGLPKWLLPLAGLAALVALGWYFFSQPSEPAAEPGAAPPIAATPKTEGSATEEPAKTVTLPDGNEVAKELTDLYASVTETLTGVKDAATAETAVPKFKGFGDTLDHIKGAWDKLPDAAKAIVGKVTTASLAKLKELAAKVLEIPGVGEKLKPILDPMLDKLASLGA